MARTRLLVALAVALSACSSDAQPPATSSTPAPVLSCAELQQAFDVARGAVDAAARRGDSAAAATPASVMGDVDRQMRAAGCYGS